MTFKRDYGLSGYGLPPIPPDVKKKLKEEGYAKQRANAKPLPTYDQFKRAVGKGLSASEAIDKLKIGKFQGIGFAARLAREADFPKRYGSSAG